jgi:hypothetical protein
MSEVKVNKISPRTNCGTTTLGDSGDTFTIPAGVSITNNGTASGFGATGAASWNTTVKTGDFTAINGEGYFVNTTSGAVSVTLPAGSAGAVVAVKDYAGTFDTNKVTLVQNGSDKIGGSTVNATLETEGIAVTLVFIDSTQGWLVTDSGLQSESPTAQFVTATGGNQVVTCGNFKTHIFTGPGNFCVSSAGNASGSNTVDYLVVAGGAGAGAYNGGGGGAGGFRVSNSVGCVPAPTMSPLVAPNSPSPAALPVSATSYPVVIGGGGAAGQAPTPSMGVTGSVSSFSTISSAGGGGGGSGASSGLNGGSGGGMGGESPACRVAGSGNTPPTTPPQGQDGGLGGLTPSGRASGGGGGAGTAGEDVQSGNPADGGDGGTGSFVAATFIGPPAAPSYGTSGPVGPSVRYFAGGGGGGTESSPSIPGGAGSNGTGGSGGGGPGGPGPADRGVGTSGTVNTGGAGGGASRRDDVGPPYFNGGAGGSGIVMIRYKFQ